MKNTRIEQLVDFLKDNPDDSFLNYALAMEYVGKGDDDTAKQFLEKVLEMDPGYEATYYHLGKLYERFGLKSEAENIYQKGIALTRSTGKHHALAELRSALNELQDNEDDDY